VLETAASNAAASAAITAGFTTRLRSLARLVEMADAPR